jgi:hypothetical protein
MSRNQFLVGPFTPMTVLVRSKRDEKGSGRRRPSAFMTRPAPAQARGPVATGRSHRERETFQDNALDPGRLPSLRHRPGLVAPPLLAAPLLAAPIHAGP